MQCAKARPPHTLVVALTIPGMPTLSARSLPYCAAKIVLDALLVFAAMGFCASLEAQEAKAGKDHRQWQREDIAVFRDEFLARDRAFTPQAREIAERRLAKLEREPASPTRFAVELCRIAALADNGHTQCLPNGLGRDICNGVAALGFNRSPWCPLLTPDSEIPDFNTVPIAFFPFGQDFNVVGVGTGESDLLGARLIAIDGRPIGRFVAILRSFAGGTLAHRDERAADVLASPQQLHAAGISRSADAVRYTFVAFGGKKVSRVFSVRSSSGTAAAWQSLPDPGRASWAFQEPGKPFRYRDAPEIDGVVVQPRKTFDAGDRKIADFLEEVETKRQRLGRKHVILDMRFNGGGNFLLIRDFMIRWPARTPGRFFVLTSRQTFSAAIASIAYLKQAGKERVTIVGEPVGDRMMFFSDGLPIRLPHSGRYFLPAVVRMDYGDGCRKYDDCAAAIAQPGRPVATGALPMLGPMIRLPIAVASLEPDIPAPWTIDAWVDAKDPMMEAVMTSMAGTGD